MSDSQYLVALQRYYRQHKSLPSFAGMAAVVGLSSTSSAHALAERFIEAGFLEKTPDKKLAPTSKFFARPLLGSVRAGLPEPAIDDTVELLNVDEYLVKDDERTAFVKIKGDSMRDAGLLNGDIAVVLRNSPTSVGDIVVASVNGETTVKYLARDDNGYFLRAANPEFHDMHPPNLEVLGVVTGMFRRF